MDELKGVPKQSNPLGEAVAQSDAQQEKNITEVVHLALASGAALKKAFEHYTPGSGDEEFRASLEQKLRRTALFIIKGEVPEFSPRAVYKDSGVSEISCPLVKIGESSSDELSVMWEIYIGSGLISA